MANNKKSQKSIKKPTKVTKRSNNKVKNFFINNSLKRNIAIFVVLFAFVGSLFIFSSSAETVAANLEAESLSSKGTVVTDNQAQGGSALRLSTADPASGFIQLNANTDKLTVRAKGVQCKGAPILAVYVDDKLVTKYTVSSTTWASYSVSLPLDIQSHFASVIFENPQGKVNGKSCSRSVTVDYLSFVTTTPVIPVLTDTTAPNVTLTSPAVNATLSGSVAVSATATDDKGVAKVEFLVGDKALLSSINTAPYTYIWDTKTVVDGSYIVTAKAYDAAGNSAESSVSITIKNATTVTPPPPPTPTVDTYVTPSAGYSEALLLKEGALIEIETGFTKYTAADVANMLRLNAFQLDRIGPTLKVLVQTKYGSFATTAAATSGPTYVTFKSIMYLDGRATSVFYSYPQKTIAHEYGHTWSYYHYYLTHNGVGWGLYHDARGITGDPRLDSSYLWGTPEIIADDYRFLFGTEDAKVTAHLQYQLPNPTTVPGLKDFFINVWGK